MPEDQFKKIENKYNLEEYIKRSISIIDEQFSEQELLELISFHQSDLGKKTSDSQFLSKLAKISEQIINELKNELSKNG